MKIYQNQFTAGAWVQPLPVLADVSLVLLFGQHALASAAAIQADLRRAFPGADIVGCTTSGAILGACIYDEGLCLTALQLERSACRVVDADFDDGGQAVFVRELIAALPLQAQGLALTSVLVLAEGVSLNGSVLVQNLEQFLPAQVTVSGGLAGDDARFEETFVWRNGDVHNRKVVLCGFYGDSLQIVHGSRGGWQPFGPDRRVTRAVGNILHTLDGKPALELYKRYLGEHAADLPASALLFPLLIKPLNGQPVIRTVLNIDEAAGTLIFAGDVPEGADAILMRASFTGLVEGARACATYVDGCLDPHFAPGLVFMVSCVGRRLVLSRRCEEELEAILDVIGDTWHYTGFYSNGEIAPIENTRGCDFHNETMTLTLITETL